MRENSTLMQLNSISATWAEQFDVQPRLELVFSENETGLLVLNGMPLNVPVSEIDPGSIYTDTEWVGFFANSGDAFDFHIIWPHEGTPCVAEVRHTFSLSQCSA